MVEVVQEEACDRKEQKVFAAGGARRRKAPLVEDGVLVEVRERHEFCKPASLVLDLTKNAKVLGPVSLTLAVTV